jgi:DNA-binding NtrC family response regulator
MPTILVIDSEPDGRRCKRNLQRDGDTVASARVEDALEAIDAEAPDVVVLEVGPPSCGGLDVMDEIRGTWPDLPIVLHTAYGSYKDDFRSWAADEYVLKSEGIEELRRSIRRAVERTRGCRAPRGTLLRSHAGARG